MKNFVHESSIVRRIWGRADTTMLIFAGASAEFAVNKEVDWLYFTGHLPADPIGRLFSTVRYAQQIIFNNETGACKAIDRINSIHNTVESSRGKNIPEKAYQDVLYMLIHYSIAAFELLERKLTVDEKNEVVDIFRKVGMGMHLTNMPGSYDEWLRVQSIHLNNNIKTSSFTKDLFKQYKKHLGFFRYFLLLETQRMMVPLQVNQLLELGKPKVIKIILPFYRMIRKTLFQKFLVSSMVPQKFSSQVKEMDQH